MRLILAVILGLLLATPAYAQQPAPCFEAKGFLEGAKKQGLKLFARGVSKDGTVAHIFVNSEGMWLLAFQVLPAQGGCFIVLDMGDSWEPVEEAGPRPFTGGSPRFDRETR